MDAGIDCGVVDETAVSRQSLLSSMLYDGNRSIDGVVIFACMPGSFLLCVR